MLLLVPSGFAFQFEDKARLVAVLNMPVKHLHGLRDAFGSPSFYKLSDLHVFALFRVETF
jgi:hypothetical protein